MSLKEQLSGTGVAIITPFTADMLVDYEALGKMLDHIINHGVDYVVTLGTTGETPVLSKEEKINIIEATYSHVNDRIPVVVGVGGNDTHQVAKDLETLPLAKATAILSASPYYNKPSQEGIFQHYRYLAERSPKPIILYNVPGRTGKNMEAHTSLRLATEVENIIGIKEASGNMQQCMEILKDRPAGFLVVSGDDALALPQLACGMDGVISVAANSFPAEFSKMVKLCLQNNFTEAKKINDELMAAYHLMFAENNPAGVKAFLAEMGLIKNVLRLPGVPLSGELQQQVKSYCSKLV
ncbi:MAG: 4-hydroxy-tetrahydrodipicolinate synthase [Niastella sp.]|nr:4-hydroxy-tetrahydrodipicolinate synthase [Niastella sp.]